MKEIRDHTLYDAIYVKCSKKVKFSQTENRFVVVWGSRLEQGLTVNEDEGSG